MGKLDLKRLHQVHFNYPNNRPGEGKTTYCFDQILRLIQLGGDIKCILYETNHRDILNHYQMRRFLEFLEEHYRPLKKRSFELINGNELYLLKEKILIRFRSQEQIQFEKGFRYDAIIKDYY